MNKIALALLLIVISTMVLSAGCLSPSGCLPMKVDDKRFVDGTNVQSLILNISGEEYTYYNPTLITFSQIEINHTYQMRMKPMFSTKPDVELCEVKI